MKKSSDIINSKAGFRQKTPLRGKYLVRDFLANRALSFLDFLLAKILPEKKSPISKDPSSFLVSNLAHMGDVLLVTSLLSVLKQRYPKARIGVLIGSWSVPILHKHPYVDKIHIIDHWKLNRSSISKLQKFLTYYKRKKDLIKEIQKEKYEIAIDSYYFFPNAIPILWQANIPTRIGYSSGGFGPLLTHSIDWKYLDQPVAYYYFAILEFLGIRQEEANPYFKLHLPNLNIQRGAKYLEEKLNRDFSKGYIVIHIGTGSSLKEWPIDKWGALVKRLSGYALVFTGKGENEKRKVKQIISEIENCFDLVDLPKWEEFLAILQDAQLIIGVDSLTGHLAAAFDVPSVLIYSGITNPNQWAPMYKKCKIVTNTVPCSPCFRSQGCEAMTCVRGVSVEKVLEACASILSI